jgi:hypothetical protein
MAHVGTHEYWVQLALHAQGPMRRVTERLAEIDREERQAREVQSILHPKCQGCRAPIEPMTACKLTYTGPSFDPAYQSWQRSLPGSYCRECADRHEEWSRCELEFDLIPEAVYRFAEEPDPEPVVWSRLEPYGLDAQPLRELDGGVSSCGNTRRHVRCQADFDSRSSMMQAFVWPTAVHPYRWPV